MKFRDFINEDENLNEGSSQNKANQVLKKELSKKYEVNGESMNGFSIKVGGAVGRISFEEQFDRDFKTDVENAIDDLKSSNTMDKVELQKDGTVYIKLKGKKDAQNLNFYSALKSAFRIWNIKVDHAINGLSGDEFYLDIKGAK
jgi:ribosomal protein S5